jgi:serine/threonine protein kinase
MPFQCTGEVASTQFTPAYAAPEILQNFQQDIPIEAHPSQDIWALGVMLYEALTCSKLALPGTPIESLMELAKGDKLYPWESAVLDVNFDRSRVRFAIASGPH